MSGSRGLSPGSRQAESSGAFLCENGQLAADQRLDLLVIVAIGEDFLRRAIAAGRKNPLLRMRHRRRFSHGIEQLLKLEFPVLPQVFEFVIIRQVHGAEGAPALLRFPLPLPHDGEGEIGRLIA